jgi:hypothetical protein
VQRRCLEILNFMRLIAGTWWGHLRDVCYLRGINSGLARTHFLKLERLQYRSLRITLGLIESTPNNSLGVLSGVSPLAERCMYLNYRYLVTIFHKHGHTLRERLETSEQIIYSEICMKGFVLSTQFTFQPSRIYAQYDLAALVSVPDFDDTMTVALASVDKSMYPSVASRKLATITERSMIDDVAGFTVHNRNYKTGHQLAKPSSVFSAEISAIRRALEHIQICPRSRYLILSDSLSSFMAMRSKKDYM